MLIDESNLNKKLRDAYRDLFNAKIEAYKDLLDARNYSLKIDLLTGRIDDHIKNGKNPLELIAELSDLREKMTNSIRKNP